MSEERREFWRGRRVFLTGHTGFKGGWLTVMLQELGAEVFAFALAPEGDRSFFVDVGVAKRCAQSTIGDIRDRGALRAAMQEANPDIVLHLAAQALVRKSYVDPVSTFETNVIGTVNVLEACRTVPSIKAIVSVTTDKVYDNKEWEWGYREIDPLGGHDPYSSSKACADIATNAYYKSFFQKSEVGLASVRAGNVIGGGDWSEDRLVPDVMLAFEQQAPAMIRNPIATRPWQHVLDPLAGYLRCAEALADDPTQFSGAYNFGPSENGTRTVADVATRLATAWKGQAEWQHENPAENPPHEARALALDVSKAKIRLGWEGKLSFEQSIELTVDWYQQRCFEDGIESFTEQQVRRFLNASLEPAN